LLQVGGHVVGGIDEPVVLDGMYSDAALLKAMYMLTKKAFLISTPLIEFRIMLHLKPHAMPCIGLPGTISEIKGKILS
jgi:hypothetical protein